MQQTAKVRAAQNKKKKLSKQKRKGLCSFKLDIALPATVGVLLMPCY
jgi:hypothetical protein